MKVLLGITLALFLWTLRLHAQPSSRQFSYVSVDPAGSCANGTANRYNWTNNKEWGCENGTWTQVNSGGGALPAGSAGCVQLYATSTTLGSGCDSVGLIGNESLLDPSIQNYFGHAPQLLAVGSNTFDTGHRLAIGMECDVNSIECLWGVALGGPGTMEMDQLASTTNTDSLIPITSFSDPNGNIAAQMWGYLAAFGSTGSVTGDVIGYRSNAITKGAGRYAFQANQSISGTTGWGLYNNGNAPIKPGTAVFTDLTAFENGAFVFCSDCTVTSGVDDTCVASGSGAFAQRVGGAWKCNI